MYKFSNTRYVHNIRWKSQLNSPKQEDELFEETWLFPDSVLNSFNAGDLTMLVQHVSEIYDNCHLRIDLYPIRKIQPGGKVTERFTFCDEI